MTVKSVGTDGVSLFSLFVFLSLSLTLDFSPDVQSGSALSLGNCGLLVSVVAPLNKLNVSVLRA